MFRPEATSVKSPVVPQPVAVEDAALGGQPAVALRLGDPDVTEDRGVDGSASCGYQFNI